MTRAMYVKFSYTLYEAKPAAYDFGEQISVNGHEVGGRWAPVWDPGETWDGTANTYSPNTGYDYYERKVATATFTRPTDEELASREIVHNQKLSVWTRVFVPDDFQIPSEYQPGGDSDPGDGSDPFELTFEDGSFSFEWSGFHLDGSAGFSPMDAMTGALSGAFKSGAVALLGQNFVTSFEQAQNVQNLLNAISQDGLNLLSNGIGNFENLQADEYLSLTHEWLQGVNGHLKDALAESLRLSFPSSIPQAVVELPGFSARAGFDWHDFVADHIVDGIVLSAVNIHDEFAGSVGSNLRATIHLDFGTSTPSDGDSFIVGTGHGALVGGGGDNVFTGGWGSATVSYASAPEGVKVDLAAQGQHLGLASNGYGGTDELININGIIGSGYDDLIKGNPTGSHWFNGGGGNDVLTGGAHQDVFTGGAGADVLLGGGSNDRLFGGGGKDRVYGGAGADVLKSGAGPDLLRGGAGHDRLIGGAGNDELHGQGGNDKLIGGIGADVLAGGAGHDVLGGGGRNDKLFGGGGDDMLEGGPGADVVKGGTGRDFASYASSNAAVTINLARGTATGGHAQGDKLVGIEDLIGSNFNDTLTGDSGWNLIEGGEGRDLVRGGAGIDDLRGGAGADVLVGGSGRDFIEGEHGRDKLIGGGGNDWLDGGPGADVLKGGKGSDMANYSASDAGVTVSLATGFAGRGEARGDTLFSIEDLQGSVHDDVLAGNSGNNLILGLEGDDVLRGGGGNDILAGGPGNDRLIGGSGADEFDLLPEDGVDTIVDFGRGKDLLVVFSSYFGGGLVEGESLAPGQFVVGAAPAASGTHGQFLYDTASGGLFWDGDGAGGDDPVQLAILNGTPALTASDFILV